MSSPFRREEEPGPISDVNVVPLADVSLVLLIILLVLSPMAAQSMLRVQSAAKAETGPKAGEDPLQPRAPEPVLAVGLTPAGYVVEGRLLGGDAELRAWLVPALARREDRKVFLAPELETAHGDVVAAIESIQGCGAAGVALVQVFDPAPGP